MDEQIDILTADLHALRCALQSLDPSYDWMQEDNLTEEGARGALIDNLMDFGADERVRVGTGFYHHQNRVHRIGGAENGWLALVEPAGDGVPARVALYPVQHGQANRTAASYRKLHATAAAAAADLKASQPANFQAMLRQAVESTLEAD